MTSLKQALIRSLPAILLAATTGMILMMVASSSEAVRLRNSLIFETVSVDELDWRPPDFPLDFKLGERSSRPAFEDALSDLLPRLDQNQTDVERALTAGTFLAVDLDGRLPVKVDFTGPLIAYPR